MAKAKSVESSKKGSSTRSVKSSGTQKQSFSVGSAFEKVTQKPASAFKVKRSHLLILILAVLAVVVIYFLRGMFVVALVNGEPIPRLSVIRELEKQGGSQVTDSLITQKLIRQDAREKNVTALDSEINEEIKTLEELYKEQGQDLESILSARAMSRNDLVDQIELKILLDKLIGDISVSDEEIATFIEENNESYGGTLTEDDVRLQLEDQKYSQKSSEYITTLQQSATIKYFLEY